MDIEMKCQDLYLEDLKLIIFFSSKFIYILLIHILVGNLEDCTDWNFIYLVERARMITMIYLIITPVMKNFFFSISYHANNLKTVNYTASRLRNKKLYSA